MAWSNLGTFNPVPGQVKDFQIPVPSAITSVILRFPDVLPSRLFRGEVIRTQTITLGGLTTDVEIDRYPLYYPQVRIDGLTLGGAAKLWLYTPSRPPYCVPYDLVLWGFEP